MKSEKEIEQKFNNVLRKDDINLSGISDEEWKGWEEALLWVMDK